MTETGINYAARISEFVNDVFEDALFVSRDNNIMTQLVTVYNDRAGMATRKNQEYGTATMRSISDTDDLTSQVFEPTALNELTPGEIGAQFFITDYRLESDPFTMRQNAAMELGMAAAQKMEVDLLSVFPNLTGGTIGGAGTALTFQKLFAAETILRANMAPGPYVAVLHPNAWFNIGTAVLPGGGIVQTNAPQFQDDVMRNFFVGRVGNIDVYTTANLTAGTESIGAIFSRSAIAFDVRRAPRLEPERDASRRGWELNLSAVYGYGKWRPRFGVQLIGDASTPS